MGDEWWNKKVDVENLTEWQALKSPEGVDYYYNTVTGDTQWDKPEELMTEEEKAAGQGWVWVPDETECFLPAQVINKHGGKVTAQLESGEQVTVKEKDVQALTKSSLHAKRVVADLTLLDQMSTPLILHNLKQRFLQDKIYTNIGNILISINPYKYELGYYTHAMVQKYIARGLEERAPHVYNTAHDAWIGLTEFKENQSIIISGESGAGKTEATKQCLKYLAAIAGSVGNIETKILQANPILEAFGNAKTIRNDNSSRFGKYMEVFFTKDMPHMICGCTTTNYLLEKIRVVAPAEDERNFHIFYQLAKAADSATKKKLMLAPAGSYRYLASCLDVNTIDDDKEYADLLKAFDDLLFTKEDQTNIFKVVSAILSLGNITFKAGAKNASVVDAKFITTAAKMLDVAKADLEKALLYRVLKIRGQKATDVPHSEFEAAYARDAMSKFVYGNMFDWLVVKINDAMGKAPKNLLSVGILDIFGFEIFKQNSFEQLCINFTNEMLQQHFNQNTFKLEEQLYRAEKIAFDHVDFIDNQPMLDLITKKRPQGVLPMLDEELVVPRGSDKNFLEKLNKTHAGKTKCFKAAFKHKDCFFVLHYAGEVLYDTRGFMDKNRDKLTDDLMTVVQSSTSPLLQELFPSGQQLSTKQKKASLGSQFQKQLNNLMATLNETEPHYIRCLKPNDDKAAMLFVPRNCLEQMTYSGVFEAVRIRKQGFPFRLKHKEFIDRYKCTVEKSKSANDIINGMKLNKDNVRTGATMILYRAEEHKALELKRSIKVKSKEIDAALREITSKSTSGMSKAEKEEYLNKLARTVMQADEFRLKTAVAEKARDLLDGFIQARLDDDPECKRALEQANASKDQKQLENALEMADRRGYQACHYVRKTRETLKQVAEANDMCKDAIKELPHIGWNTQALGAAIANADSFQYSSMIVEECRQLQWRVDRVMQEAAAANQTMDEPHVRAVVQAAQELGIRNQYTDYFAGLVRGEYDVFLQKQYETAKQINDHPRAIRADIKRKDLLVQKHGGDFALRSYKGLKRAEAWAKQKFFGNKQKLAQSFLQWQKGAIHAEMVTYNVDKSALKLKKKMLKAAFKALQQFMSGKPGASPKLTMALQQAEGDATLRDELYIHTLKQLTNIPPTAPPTSKDKGFEWLGCLVNAFAPSEDMVNIVETFLRNNDAQVSKWCLKGQLRRTAYNGKGQAPSDSDINSGGQFLNSKNKDFADPAQTGQESYCDIQQSYFEVLRHNNIQPIMQGGGGGGPGRGGPGGMPGGGGRGGGPGRGGARGGARGGRGGRGGGGRGGARGGGMQQQRTAQPVQQQRQPVQQQQRAAAPAAAAPAAQSEWAATVDPTSGRTYYYNTR